MSFDQIGSLYLQVQKYVRKRNTSIYDQQTPKALLKIRFN